MASHSEYSHDVKSCAMHISLRHPGEIEYRQCSKLIMVSVLCRYRISSTDVDYQKAHFEFISATTFGYLVCSSVCNQRKSVFWRLKCRRLTERV